MLRTYIERPDGSLYINPAKRHVRSFWLQALDNPVVQIPANGQARARYLISNEGHFEIAYLMARFTDPRILVEIQDEGTRRRLNNRPLALTTIAGTAQRPSIWPETYFLNVESGARVITVTFTDFSGAPNEVEMTMHGRRFYFSEAPPPVQLKMREYFLKKERTNVYFLTTNEDVVIPAGGQLVDQAAPVFQATDEADTDILKATMFPDDANFFCRFREFRSNKALSNGFVHATNVFGNAQFPFILPESFLLERNYRAGLDIISNDAQADQTVNMTLFARRMYYA